MTTTGSVPAQAPAPRVGFVGWLLYAVAVLVGLALALSTLLTVLIASSAPSVALAAVVAVGVGLAVAVGAAPALRRRAPAMLVGGLGAGLMAGGVALAASALMIVIG